MQISIKDVVTTTDAYNFHAHSQYCDGRDTMSAIAAAAAEAGMKYFAFTPHSPVPIDSPCNMDKKKMDEYMEEVDRLHRLYSPDMVVLKSLEIDYLGDDWGPHIDYFQRLPLDFRLGSVHFVPNQDGVLLDCDGRFERFARYLKEGYRSDLRYVVEKYFEHVSVCLNAEVLNYWDTSIR